MLNEISFNIFYAFITSNNYFVLGAVLFCSFRLPVPILRGNSIVRLPRCAAMRGLVS